MLHTINELLNMPVFLVQALQTLHCRYILMVSQIMSIIIINILKYAMKIFMKCFFVGNLNLCHVLKNIMRKILEMCNLTLEQ